MLLTTGPETAKHTLLLAHGAGAPMDSEFMNDMAERLAARAVRVVRFEFPYMQRLRSEGKRSAPDRMPVLEASFRETAANLADPRTLFIGGKSMGGRVATLVAEELGVRGVVALGYPFHPPAKPESLRTSHLRSLTRPCLIVQGTRDTFGTREEVAGYELAPSIEWCWLEDGDHSFEPRKKSGHTLAQHMERAADAVCEFMMRVGPR